MAIKMTTGNPTSGTVQAEQGSSGSDEIPRQLEQLRKSGQKRGSRSDPESRYLRRRGGFCLGTRRRWRVRTIIDRGAASASGDYR